MSPAPVTGARALAGAAVLVVAVVAGVHALEPLLAPGSWTTVALLAVVGVAATTSAVRRTSRSRVAPTLWGLLAAVVGLAAVYSGTTTSPTLPLPTPETGERLVRLASSGVTAITEGRVPLEPVRGVELLVVAGAVAAYLLADLLGLALGRAGLAGLALLSLWVPVTLFELEAGVGWVLLAGVAFLVLLTLTRPQASTGARGVARDTAPALVAAAGVAVAAVVLGPVAAAAPGYGSVRLDGGWGPGPGSGPLQLSTDLDMRDSLGSRSDRPVLTYTTDAASPGPLRTYTRTDFDGREWTSDGASGAESPLDGILWPTDVAVTPETPTSRLQVTVGALAQDRLPIPLDPREVAIGSRWSYDPLRDEVLSRSATTREATYTVTVYERDLTEEALRADRPVELPATSPLLAVPETEHVEDIRRAALEVTAEAETAYDQALALQMFFRDASQFRYDTDVPPARTDDAVWDFLTDRTGFCVQYATAMTVMARTLGIPARLGIGFLPGRASREVVGEFVVTGRQAHAWPELWFEDAGWVRFEPTPAAQTGAPPAYADPFGGLPFEEQPQIPGQVSQAPVQPAATVAPGGAGVGGTIGVGTAEVPVPAAVGGGLVVLGLLGGAGWWLRTRRRATALPEGPEAWWTHLRAVLADHGITWSDALTPRQAAETVERELDERDRLDDDGRAALRGLVAAVERERYAPEPAAPDSATLGAWVAAITGPLSAVREPAHR